MILAFYIKTGRAAIPLVWTEPLSAVCGGPYIHCVRPRGALTGGGVRRPLRGAHVQGLLLPVFVAAAVAAVVVVVLGSPVLGLEGGVQGVLPQVDLQGALGVQGGRRTPDGTEIHDGLYGGVGDVRT